MRALAALMAAAAATLAHAYDNGAPLAALPPRGWTTWCTDDYCGLIDLCWESEVRSVADAMVSSGLVAAGYQLVLLDDCWSAESRDPVTDELVADPSRFPSGIPALAQYLGARNLTLGMYTCSGTKTCKWGRPGSWGHYEQDAETLTRWGARWIKADNCNTGGTQPSPQRFANFSAAINATGVPTVFHSCQWGEDDVDAWGPNVTQVYRINPDHLPLWRYESSMGGQGTADIIEVMASPAVTAGLAPYSYPDPDFLMTGLFPLTQVESETEFAFWALWSAPLIVATDVRNMSAWKAGLLMNPDALAINWDAALRPAVRLRSDNATGQQLWSKQLADGDIAVALYNAGDSANATMAVTWAELGWAQEGASVRVYDIRARKLLSPGVQGGFTAPDVPPHGSAFWRLSLLGA